MSTGAASYLWKQALVFRSGNEARHLALVDRSRIAVVGGGPAGSLFAYFVRRVADSIDVDVRVDIYEPRSFAHEGPRGCNHCGGIVSESLVQLLAIEGINVPPGVVQRGIASYMLHTDVGDVRIETPAHEKRIASVFRGNGPRESRASDVTGFDRFLLELSCSVGATVVRRLVSGLRVADDGVDVSTPDGLAGRYDMVAVATGVNSQLPRILGDAVPGYEPPGALRTFICEFDLGEETVGRCLGDSMHVFLLDIPRLEFAALIPKGRFATLCLLGENVDDALIERFLATPEVSRCFPGSVVPRPACHCFPRINTVPAARPFADRIVCIGDSGVARLYKDGIGSAYRTAKAAANSAVLHGISARDFEQHFWPECHALIVDNRIARVIFGVTTLIQRLRFIRRGVLRMTAAEQASTDADKAMSSVLWDIFTGSAPYREILVRTLWPSFPATLAWNVIAGNASRRKVVAAREPTPVAGRRDEGREMEPRDRVTGRPPSRERPRAEVGQASDCTPLTAFAPVRSQPAQVKKPAPCTATCAAGGDVRGWIGVIAQRRKLRISDADAYARAWSMIAAVNPFPATLGRICPHPCEDGCTHRGQDGALAINALERFLGDWALRQRLRLPVLDKRPRPESIGVVGAGPAGLSFAYQMARRGYRTTVYEKQKKPGGMLTYGIPPFRLPVDVLEAEIRRVLDLGVELRLSTAIGRDVSTGELRRRHSVLFLGIGAARGVRLNISGEQGSGVWPGVEFLSTMKRGASVALGSRVIVIGGGNTALDAARVARRSGATVTILYRRTSAEMPANASEIEAALSEGITLQYLSSPVKIERSRGVVTGVVAQRMQLAEADASGRRRSLPLAHTEFTLSASSVIVAASQETDWSDLGEFELPRRFDESQGIESRGTRVLAGGDVLRQGIAGSAIAHGRRAAEAVHAKLRGLQDVHLSAASATTGPVVKTEYYAPKERVRVPSRPVDERLVHPDAEVEPTLSEQAFLGEVSRCFSCGLCFGCEQCSMYCNAGAFTRLHTAAPGAYFALSLDRCEGCGKCVELCPCGFLSIASRPVPDGSVGEARY